MRTIKVKVYKFEELKPEIQEKIIEESRYINVEYGNWASITLDEWEKKLKAMGFEDINIEYSGFSSQGDGASFTGKITDQESLIKLMEGIDKEKYKPLRFAMRREEVELYANIINLDNHYSHEKTKRLELDMDEIANNINPKRLEILEQLADDLEATLEEKRFELSKEIYKALEGEYEGLTSDEAVKDTLTINDFEFLEEGEQFYT